MPLLAVMSLIIDKLISEDEPADFPQDTIKATEKSRQCIFKNSIFFIFINRNEHFHLISHLSSLASIYKPFPLLMTGRNLETRKPN